MGREYYGATADAQRAVNAMLALPATGREQDWEIEFADPGLVEPILGLLASDMPDLDVRCALALLLVASLDEGAGDGTQGSGPELIERAEKLLKADQAVHEAMTFFWLDQHQALDEERIGALLLGHG